MIPGATVGEQIAYHAPAQWNSFRPFSTAQQLIPAIRDYIPIRNVTSIITNIFYDGANNMTPGQALFIWIVHDKEMSYALVKVAYRDENDMREEMGLEPLSRSGERMGRENSDQDPGRISLGGRGDEEEHERNRRETGEAEASPTSTRPHMRRQYSFETSPPTDTESRLTSLHTKRSHMPTDAVKEVRRQQLHVQPAVQRPRSQMASFGEMASYTEHDSRARDTTATASDYASTADKKARGSVSRRALNTPPMTQQPPAYHVRSRAYSEAGGTFKTNVERAPDMTSRRGLASPQIGYHADVRAFSMPVRSVTAQNPVPASTPAGHVRKISLPAGAALAQNFYARDPAVAAAAAAAVPPMQPVRDASPPRYHPRTNSNPERRYSIFRGPNRLSADRPRTSNITAQGQEVEASGGRGEEQRGRRRTTGKPPVSRGAKLIRRLSNGLEKMTRKLSRSRSRDNELI